MKEKLYRFNPPAKHKGKMRETDFAKHIEGRSLFPSTIDVLRSYYVHGESMSAIALRHNATRQAIYATLRRG